jgi:hypothetical protein
MDALLATEARHALEALSLSRSPASAGILLGHKRGFRFIIERVVPTRAGYYPTQRTYLRLDALFQQTVIGFFSFSAAAGLAKLTPPPFAVGKVFLCLKRGPNGRLSFRTFSPDHSGRFILRPVRMATVKGKNS